MELGLAQLSGVEAAVSENVRIIESCPTDISALKNLALEMAPGEFIVREEAPGKYREEVEKVWRAIREFFGFAVPVRSRPGRKALRKPSRKALA